MRRKKIAVFVLIAISIILSVAFAERFLPFISFGENITVSAEANLSKYNNYYLSEENKGTLVQYEIRTKVEQEGDHLPIKQSVTSINLGAINDNYPNDIKVLTKDTEKELSNKYDEVRGILSIENNQPNESEEYIVIANYDTYTNNEDEREIKVEVIANVTIEDEEERQISSHEEYQNIVTSNIGELTSIYGSTQEISLGGIKSNKINETTYTTQYEQQEEIMISKKDAQETVEIKENDLFLVTNEEENKEIPNNQNIIYRNTKINTSDLKEILGEEGKVEDRKSVV